MNNSNHYKDNLENFIRICSLKDLKEKEGKRFFADDTEIALFKIGDEVFALSNICPHQHSALIYDGFLEDDCVVCPAHGWMFNLRTGKQPAGGGGLTAYPVIVHNNDVYVKVIKKELKW